MAPGCCGHVPGGVNREVPTIADQKKDDARDVDESQQEGKLLPHRELMSLLSADPVDPMYSTIIPADGPPFTRPPGDTMPVEGPETAGTDGTDSSSTSVSDTDTSSPG